jgi:hypothetical protein
VLYISAGVLAVAVLGAAVVLLAEGREPVTFEPDTPQAAMQAYMAAWQDDDYDAAYLFFSDEVRADTSLEEYESQARGFGDSYGGSERAVYIDRADGDEQRVTLYLTVEEYYDGGGGIGGDSYRSQREVRMVQQPDGWKIDEPLIGLEQFQFGEPGF